ncbi:MAG: hypothetical protein V9G12_13225 [Microthrixaceae bacterium]
MAEEFAGGGVDDADVEVGDEDDDAGSGVFSADPDVVQAAVVAQRDLAGGTWLVLGVVVMMVLAEQFPIDLELRHESHSFSFSKIPIVIGVFLFAPFVAVAARLVSSLIVLCGFQRQPPMKLLINLLAHMLEVMVAATVVIALRPPGPLGPAAWGVAVLAVTAADLVAAVVISAAISAFQGRWEPGLMDGVVAGLIAGVPDVAFAIAMVTMLEAHHAVAWVVLGSGVAFVIVSRAYSAVSARYRAMQLLDRFTRAISGAVIDGTATASLLQESAEILHADAAWLIVAEPERTVRITVVDGETVEESAHPIDLRIIGEPGEAARLETEDGPLEDLLRSDGRSEVIFCTVGHGSAKTVILVVADRSGTVRPFDSEDVALFETLGRTPGSRCSTSNWSTSSATRSPRPSTRRTTTRSPGCPTAACSRRASGQRSTAVTGRPSSSSIWTGSRT